MLNVLRYVHDVTCANFRCFVLLLLLNGFTTGALAQTAVMQPGGTDLGSNNSTATGVDIPLANPSFEDVPQVDAAPKGWFKFGQTPDIQPGVSDIHRAPADGNTYVGCLHAPFYDEAIGQQLTTPMKAGVTYTVSFDLAYPSYYSTGICSGSFAIYGSNAAAEKQVLLWHTEGFMHKDWQRYTAVFTPTTDLQYLIIGPDNDAGCASSRYTAALFDNFATVLHALPVISTTTTGACAGSENGSARVKIADNAAGYQYLWTPGNYTTAEVNGLPAGTYHVRVIDALGIVSNRTVTVGATTLSVTPRITPPTCNNRNDAAITLSTSGGTAPYTYSMRAHTFQDTPQFSNLAAGTYSVNVRDAAGCATVVEGIDIDNPPVLRIDDLTTHPITCDNNEPQVAVVADGGVAPYHYSVDGIHWQAENTFTRLDAGNYEVLVSDANHCQVSGTASVTRNDAQCAVVVPNAFSPNNDGRNDLFRPRAYANIMNYRFTIYNRWGQPLFDTRDPNAGWDGYFKGQLQEAGAYVWVLIYQDAQGQDRKQTGGVSLVRG